MKKILSVFALMVAALCAVSSGGQQDFNAMEKSDSPVGVDAYKPDSGKTYTFSWIGYQLAPISEKAEMVEYWEELFGNVVFDVQNIEYNKWNEVLNLKFAAGEIPDRIKVIGYPNLAAYHKQDLLAEIPDAVFRDYAPHVVQKINDVDAKYMNIGLIGNERYAFVDGFYSNGTIRKPTVMRGDWLSNLNLDTPVTLGEFEDVMYAFSRNDPDMNGLDDTYGLSKSGLMAVYGAFGYIPEKNFWQERDGRLVFSAIQPEMKEALALLNKWYEDGVLDPEFITGENSGGYWAISHAFANGRIGFTCHANYYHWIPELYEGFQPVGTIQEMLLINPEAARQIAHIEPPVGPNGIKGAKKYSTVSSEFSGFGVQLESEPDKLARLLEVIDYMNASDYQISLTVKNGIEGKHWEFDEQGNIKALGIYSDGKELAKIGAHGVLNVFNPLDFDRIQNLPRIEWAEQFNYQNDGIENALKTSLPSSPKYKGELDKLVEQTYIEIITGDKPLDYFDDFASQWLSSGGEQLVVEANEWYETVK